MEVAATSMPSAIDGRQRTQVTGEVAHALRVVFGRDAVLRDEDGRPTRATSRSTFPKPSGWTSQPIELPRPRPAAGP